MTGNGAQSGQRSFALSRPAGPYPENTTSLIGEKFKLRESSASAIANILLTEPKSQPHISSTDPSELKRWPQQVDISIVFVEAAFAYQQNGAVEQLLDSHRNSADRDPSAIGPAVKTSPRVYHPAHQLLHANLRCHGASAESNSHGLQISPVIGVHASFPLDGVEKNGLFGLTQDRFLGSSAVGKQIVILDDRVERGALRSMLDVP